MDFPATFEAFLPGHQSSALEAFSDLISDTISQVNRDLQFFGEKWRPENSLGLQELIASLAVCLQGIQQDSGKLPQLMYRIDVSEARLSEILGAWEAEEAWLHVSALVWHREMKKVWLRKQFSSG